jgi:lipopolysaccharide transport system permease protein
VAPLVMMLTYTVVFSGILALTGSGRHTSFGDRALIVFSGMVVFNLATELLARGPGLLHEHASFIKRSIFPTETLAWVAVLRALVYSGISFCVLLLVKFATTLQMPPTVLLMPLLVAPFVLLLVGATWFLMALGAFMRDTTHLIATILPVLIWITPVFYRFDDVPVQLQPLMHLNIMADYIDMLRDIVLKGVLPDAGLYGACVVVSYAVFMLGYVFFTRYKTILVDVI